MLKDNTDEILAEVDRLIKRKLERSALLVQRTAKQLCPVKTGTLRRSITHVMALDGKSVYIGSNIEYAPYVEIGTSKMAAKPYLRRALEANIIRIRKIFKS